MRAEPWRLELPGFSTGRRLRMNVRKNARERDVALLVAEKIWRTQCAPFEGAST